MSGAVMSPRATHAQNVSPKREVDDASYTLTGPAELEQRRRADARSDALIAHISMRIAQLTRSTGVHAPRADRRPS